MDGNHSVSVSLLSCSQSQSSDTEGEERPPPLLNNDNDTPFLSQKAITALTEIMDIFSDAITKGITQRLCKRVPYNCTETGTFLIDIGRLITAADLPKDGLGTFINQSCDWHYFNYDQSTEEFVKCSQETATWEIKSTHYKLKRDHSFLRRIVELRENRSPIRKDNKPIYAVIVYRFNGNKHPLPPIQPHGNSKNSRPFTGTKRSVIESVKRQIGKQSYNSINEQLYEAAGGIYGVQTDIDYPRNIKQIYNVNASMASSTSLANKEIDEMKSLLGMLGKSNSAIRNIHFSKDCRMSLTLATDSQLGLLETLCCNEAPIVLGVDMTYNCTEGFYVTPTALQHLMLLHNDTLVSPSLLGPTLIHTEHNEPTYRNFASDLVNSNATLRGIKFLGSDRQKEIFNAFKIHMPQLRLLLCRKHVGENIERYLNRLNLSAAVKQNILDDIFIDLIESLDEEHLMESFANLKEKWDKINPNIHKWFQTYQLKSFATSLIQDIRIDAGLSKGKHFYNNANESMNNLLKTHISRKTSITKLVAEWEELVASQETNVMRALLDEGKYSLKAQYKYLGINKHNFLKKNEEDRRKLLKTFNSAYRKKSATGAATETAVSLTQTIMEGVSTKAGRKAHENPRKRKAPSATSCFCTDEALHATSVILLDRLNPIPKTSRKISICYKCNRTYSDEDQIVGCVKTYRKYLQDGKIRVTTDLRNVYVHLSCLDHQDFKDKPIHICNYMHKMLTPDQLALIERHFEL